MSDAEVMAEVLGEMGLEKLEIELLPGASRDWSAVDAVEGFLQSPDKRFLTLGGDTGTGKTIAAATALVHVCREPWYGYGPDGKADLEHPNYFWTPKAGRFYRAVELATMPTFGAAAEKAWGRLRDRKLLVVDDLGTEAITEHWLARLGDLVDYRMRGSNKTIFTTNLPSKDLKARYGDRVFRRLTDRGAFWKATKPGGGAQHSLVTDSASSVV